MRLMSIVTAALVVVALYMVIMQRDRLGLFASGEASAAAVAQEETAEASSQNVQAPPQRESDAPVSVVTRTSTAQPIQSGIVLSGRTEAARKVEVRSETTGLVISDPIRKGAAIQSGDLLCQIDPGTRQASLAEARARLVEAETNLTTSSKLVERGFSSETDLVSKQAAMESAQAQVQQAERELDRLRIVAPFDGILESDTAELGSLLQPGGACATLISLDPIKLVGYVPEKDVERLETGSPAGARLITGQVLSGQVTFLSRSADELTRTFRVEVTVPNPDRSIRDGVTAEILIGLAGEIGHLIPQSALTLNDAGDLGIRAAVGDVARFMAVKLIRDDPKGVWVSGLPDSVDVIVVGQDFVRDGRAIVPTPEGSAE